MALKYPFLCAKSSVYFIVLRHFRLAPHTSFGLVTALLLVCGYLVPTVFIETRDQKFSNTISDVNVFLPSTAFAFSCLEKIVF